jgi:cytochrome P450
MTSTSSTTCPHSGGAAPDPDAMQSLTDYREVEEVFRSPAMAPFLHDGTEEFRGGTVRQIDGPAHRIRRRTMGRLLRGQGDQRFRQEVLMPTIERNLQRVLEAPTDGLPATDMVLFARVAFFQLVSALIGLDGVDSVDDAEQLRQSAEPIQVAMRSWYMGGDRTAVMTRGIEAREQFRKRYFEPALERRLALVRAATTPEEQAALPNDFLTLVARDLDADWTADRGLALREAVTDFINAGTFSSSFTLVHALDECLTWAEQNPQDRERLLDEQFLAQAVAEALRLHPIVPLFYRTATESVTLSSGRTFRAGEHVCLEIGVANRDATVFGPDAESFVPGRTLPDGVYPYGIAFGTGRHMCFGMPVIVGSDGVNGSHVQVLKALFAAGVQRDPARAPRMNDQFGRMDALWDVYPIQFAPDGVRGA